MQVHHQIPCEDVLRLMVNKAMAADLIQKRGRRPCLVTKFWVVRVGPDSGLVVLPQHILTIYHSPFPFGDEYDIRPSNVIMCPTLLMYPVQAGENAFACYLCSRRERSILSFLHVTQKKWLFADIISGDTGSDGICRPTNCVGDWAFMSMQKGRERCIRSMLVPWPGIAHLRVHGSRRNLIISKLKWSCMSETVISWSYTCLHSRF